MNVRHKRTGEIEEVEGKFVLSTGIYYLQKIPGAIRFDALDEADYEPIPDDRWVDVTEQCERKCLSMGGGWGSIEAIMHKGFWIYDRQYRLVKERLCRSVPGEPNCLNHIEDVWAFRVERKEIP